jgi:hypothetical protein
VRHPRFRASLRACHLILTGALALLGAAVVPAMATTGPAAELASGNLFMGTTRVEVGARPNGSFGSTLAAPPGYNPRTEGGNILGFRVNPTGCSWTDPSCVTLGDFFTPGTPYEAWGIQIGNGTPAYNSIFGTGVPGAFASADAARVTGVWQSTGAFNGITVKQTYSIPQYAWMIDTTVDLTNTSGATVNDVYVMRGLDPDNCRMKTLRVCDSNGDGVADATGQYTTHNAVETPQGSANAGALVTATQTDDSYLGLRAVGTEARAFAQNGGFTNPANLSTLWSGGDAAYHSTPASTFGDAGIYAVVRVPSIAPGATATVHVQYVVKEIPAAADFAETVASSGGLIDVGARNGGNAFQATCTAPSHGTVTAEGGGMRYTPAAGFSGTDTFTYSTGGPCGTITVTVAPAPAVTPTPSPAPAPAPAPAVVLLGAGKRTTLASGRLRMAQSLRFNRTGRYTFIVNDPATGGRVLQCRGSRVGERLLSKTFSAPVVVISQEGKTLTLVSIFKKNLSAKTRKAMTMRIVLKGPDGTLSDATR